MSIETMITEQFCGYTLGAGMKIPALFIAEDKALSCKREGCGKLIKKLAENENAIKALP